MWRLIFSFRHFPSVREEKEARGSLTCGQYGFIFLWFFFYLLPGAAWSCSNPWARHGACSTPRPHQVSLKKWNPHFKIPHYFGCCVRLCACPFYLYSGDETKFVSCVQEMSSSATKSDPECWRNEARSDVEDAGEEAPLQAGQAVSGIHTWEDTGAVWCLQPAW